MKTNPMFMWMMFMTTIMSLSSPKIIILWVMIELSNMSFILLSIKNNKKMYEPYMMYFIIQTLASISIMMSSITSMNMNPNSMNMPLILSMMMKMGAFPFHSWVIITLKKMKINQMMILLSWQKIIPISMMCKMKMNSTINLLFLMTAIMGSIMMMNMTTPNNIIISSSISHTGWILLCTSMSNTLSYIYMMLYFPITIWMMNMMKNMNLQKNVMSNPNSISPMIMIFSMMGIPPMMGFLPKMITMESMTNQSKLTLFTLMILSVMNLFSYSNLIINQSMKWMKTKKSFNQPISNTLSNSMNLLTPWMIMTL